MRGKNSSDTLQRWQALLDQIDLIEQWTSATQSETQLLAFEAQTGITFPFGYKEFCQVFGSGEFGDFVRIYGCLTIERSQEDISFFKESLESIKEWQKGLNTESVESLLNSAVVFGGTSRSESFIWDLRTYSESDRSYNIYLLRIDDPEAYLVGRNFIEFVRDFCLGMKAFEVLPEDLWPRPRALRLTFTR